jgi:hypothetical protein
MKQQQKNIQFKNEIHALAYFSLGQIGSLIINQINDSYLDKKERERGSLINKKNRYLALKKYLRAQLQL